MIILNNLQIIWAKRYIGIVFNSFTDALSQSHNAGAGTAGYDIFSSKGKKRDKKHAKVLGLFNYVQPAAFSASGTSAISVAQLPEAWVYTCDKKHCRNFPFRCCQ